MYRRFFKNAGEVHAVEEHCDYSDAKNENYEYQDDHLILIG